MLCPHCGGNTPQHLGHCSVCGAAIPSEQETRIATGILTPPPVPELLREGADAPTIRATGGEESPAPATTPLRSPGVRGTPGPLGQGQSFGTRYHIIRLLGAGGMGAVYQAWDDELGVAVALKVILPQAAADPDAARELERRFKRELLLARQVTHKNVVRIHDLGEIDGIKYITMPYVHGADLGAILRRDGRLPLPRVLRVVRQVASGLLAAHEVGVVHRDLKPANIMLDADDSAYIMDFGIARSATGTHAGTVAGTVVGTIDYMAPEQARGEVVDARADIYAFGLIVRDMLVGWRVASGDSAVTELMQRMVEPPASVRLIDPQIPEAVDRIITRCLQPDPAQRYRTTAELVADLDALDGDGRPKSATDLHTRPSGFALPIPGRSWAIPWKGVALAGVVVTLAAGGWQLWKQVATRPQERQATPAQSTSLVILPFRNSSGDPTLDWLASSLAEILRSEIGHSQSVRTVPPERVYQILKDLRIGNESNLDPATLRRLAEFTSADTIVWGQYVRFGDEIRIDGTLEYIRQQRRVPLRAQAVNQAALLPAISQLARSIRENVAASPDIRKQLEAGSFTPSTRSIDALRFYNEGLQLARQGNHLEAVKRFKAATEADGEFALGYAKLAQAYSTLGHDSDAEQFSRRSAELSHQLPPRERYLVLANHARILNDTAKAIESYENLLKVAPGDTETHFALATLYEGGGALDRARDHFLKVTQVDPKHIDALLAVGRVEIRRRNPEGSLDHLHRALTLAVQLNNDEARGSIVQAMGIAYKRLNKLEEALRHFTEALEIRQRLGQTGGVASTLNEIAQVQQSLGRPDIASKMYEQALELRRKIGDKRGIGNTLIDMGRLRSAQSQYDAALALYRESLQFQRETGNANYEALCLNNIGSIYSAKGQYDDAQTYFERALELRDKGKIPAEIAETLHNLAETSLKRGHYTAALSYYLRATESWRNAGDKRGVAIESYSMGGVFEAQGRYSAALKAKGEALATFRELGDRSFWMAEILSGYGSALVQIGRGDEAVASLEEASALARELKNEALRAQILNIHADRLYYRGDLKGARDLVEQALQAASRAGHRQLILRSRVSAAKLDVKERPGGVALTQLATVSREADALGLKVLAVECALYRAEALIARGDHQAARQELNRAIGEAEKVGLSPLQAKGRYLIATSLRLTHSEAEARRHYREAYRLLDEIRREAGSDAVLKRADFSAMYADARRWAQGA
jgi:serine/threonine protein kinase/tetratricopeptide (TPR) repeat protein